MESKLETKNVTNTETEYKLPEEAMLMLEFMKSVWDCKAIIILNDTCIPILSGWYEENENDEKIFVEYWHVNNKWKRMKKYSNTEELEAETLENGLEMI